MADHDPTFSMPPFPCPHCGGEILVDRMARDGSKITVLGTQLIEEGPAFPAWVQGLGLFQLRRSVLKFDRLLRDLRATFFGRLGLWVVGFKGDVDAGG